MEKRKKYGGRVAGTPNKTTATVRAAISKMVTEYYNSEQFTKDLAELEPRDRVYAMEKLSAYVTPKLQNTSLDVIGEAKITIEDKLRKLAEEENN